MSQPALTASSIASPEPPAAQSAENPIPIIKRSRQRRGKVARLPKEVRARIDQLLDDGFPFDEIPQQLGEQGRHLTADSIRRWKKGGYQDHLREQRLLDESRLRYQLTLDLAREDQGIQAFQAAHKLAAALICEAVAELGADSLREAIKANPLNLLRMLNSLARLTTGGLKCERHLADQAQLQLNLNSQPPPQAKRGITPESIKEMTEKLNLM
ncbi:MAG TPA: hypothetical protein VNZ64_20500 [Candidatus Acidoferrum sp.]|jgi:hypothetical protein|nr:hypothetical protein [Candidatus Acidoferrum sp.]